MHQLQILIEMYFFSKALCQILPLYYDIYSLFKNNQRSLLDAILNILEIVSISDLDKNTSIADLIINVYPEFHFFIMMNNKFEMATECHFEYIFVPATVADSGKIILIWDNDKKDSAKFHSRLMIFYDFRKNTKKRLWLSDAILNILFLEVVRDILKIEPFRT